MEPLILPSPKELVLKAASAADIASGPLDFVKKEYNTEIYEKMKPIMSTLKNMRDNVVSAFTDRSQAAETLFSLLFTYTQEVFTLCHIIPEADPKVTFNWEDTAKVGYLLRTWCSGSSWEFEAANLLFNTAISAFQTADRISRADTAILQKAEILYGRAAQILAFVIEEYGSMLSTMPAPPSDMKLNVLTGLKQLASARRLAVQYVRATAGRDRSPQLPDAGAQNLLAASAYHTFSMAAENFRVDDTLKLGDFADTEASPFEVFYYVDMAISQNKAAKRNVNDIKNCLNAAVQKCEWHIMGIPKRTGLGDPTPHLNFMGGLKKLLDTWLSNMPAAAVDALPMTLSMPAAMVDAVTPISKAELLKPDSQLQTLVPLKLFRFVKDVYTALDKRVDDLVTRAAQDEQLLAQKERELDLPAKLYKAFGTTALPEDIVTALAQVQRTGGIEKLNTRSRGLATRADNAVQVLRQIRDILEEDKTDCERLTGSCYTTQSNPDIKDDWEALESFERHCSAANNTNTHVALQVANSLSILKPLRYTKAELEKGIPKGCEPNPDVPSAYEFDRKAADILTTTRGTRDAVASLRVASAALKTATDRSTFTAELRRMEATAWPDVANARVLEANPDMVRVLQGFAKVENDIGSLSKRVDEFNAALASSTQITQQTAYFDTLRSHIRAFNELNEMVREGEWFYWELANEARKLLGKTKADLSTAQYDRRKGTAAAFGVASLATY